MSARRAYAAQLCYTPQTLNTHRQSTREVKIPLKLRDQTERESVKAPLKLLDPKKRSKNFQGGGSTSRNPFITIADSASEPHPTPTKSSTRTESPTTPTGAKRKPRRGLKPRGGPRQGAGRPQARVVIKSPDMKFGSLPSFVGQLAAKQEGQTLHATHLTSLHKRELLDLAKLRTTNDSLRARNRELFDLLNKAWQREEALRQQCSHLRRSRLEDSKLLSESLLQSKSTSDELSQHQRKSSYNLRATSDALVATQEELSRSNDVWKRREERIRTAASNLARQVEDLKQSLVLADLASQQRLARRTQEFTTTMEKAQAKKQSVLDSAARSLELQVAEAKRKFSVRPVRTGDEPAQLAKNQKRWAGEADFHLWERRGMSDKQVLVTAKALAKMSLEAVIESDDQSSDSDTTCDAIYARTKRAKQLLADAFDAPDDVVHDFLLSKVNVDRVLPAQHKKELKQIGGEELASGLNEYWDDGRCLFIKQQLQLSNPQYRALREYLTKRYNPDAATFVPLVINGVALEALPSSYFLEKKENEMVESLTLQESKDGRFANVKLLEKLTLDIREHVRVGTLIARDGQILGAGGLPVVICWSFDACRVFRGMKQTSFGYRIVNLIEAPSNSPVYFHEFALMEAGDDHLSIRQHAQSMLDDVNELVVAGTSGAIEVDGQSVPMEFIVCLDLAAMNSCLGQGGNNMAHSCPLCHCHQDDLKSTEGRVWRGCAGCASCDGCDGNLADLKGCKGCKDCAGCDGLPSPAFFPSRSLDEAAALAHAVPGWCPGCRMDIVEKVTDPTSQRPVIGLGAKPPKVPPLFKGAAPSTLHSNQKPGQTPCLAISLSRYCICVLHMHLRFIAMMWKASVLSDPDLSKKVSGTKGCANGTLAAWIWAVLVSVGIHVKLPTSPAKDVNKYYHSISKHSFHGRDASALLCVWRRILRMVFTEKD